MVERTHPEHIWAYDDGADVMAFDWDNASGGAVKYVRADVAEAKEGAGDEYIENLRTAIASLQRQLSEAVERAEMAERQGEDQWAGWVKADCRARAAEARADTLAAALKPFADIAGEAWADENGWTDAACQKDRICDWFGPSDFHAARAALQGEPK